MAEAIFTIGYEGSSPQTFIDVLRKARVDTLFDIRARASSRRPGFAKSALSRALGNAGIAYVHERRLGSPPEARAIAKAGGSLDEFFAVVDAYLASQTDALAEVARAKGRIALMCMEHDFTRCHRKSVAREVGKLCRLEPTHLDASIRVDR